MESRPRIPGEMDAALTRPGHGELALGICAYQGGELLVDATVEADGCPAFSAQRPVLVCGARRRHLAF
ncbi:MAG: hypothetical protein JO147_08385 [Actinobacteria bacterium]|nr:hypothetical protein [Actinomycetota bacterium]